MTIAAINKVLKLIGSLAIILLASWAKGRVKAGKEIVVAGNDVLRIFPVHVKERVEEESLQNGAYLKLKSGDKVGVEASGELSIHSKKLSKRRG